MRKKPAAGYSDANAPLSRLHLDPLNPRHDPIADEDEIIAQLYAKEKVLAMAKDIVQRGAISPLERTGVIRMEGNPTHYVAVEGNRRLCALKLLRDPRKAPSPEARRVMELLAKKAAVPTSIPVVVFNTRPVAKPWVDLRHLGAQGGAGIRPWNSTQKTRAAGTNTPNALALQVLDRGTAAGWISFAQRKDIGITTLTRYLKNPVVRTALGLADPHTLRFTHEASEVDVALRRFLLDALPPKGSEKAPLVNSRSDAAERKAYGKALITTGASPRTLLDAPIDPPPPNKTAAAQKKTRQRHPDDSLYVVIADFDFSRGDPQLQRMAGELKTLPAEEHPFAANYLLRAVLERVMVLYAKKLGIHRPKMGDQKLTEECEKALERGGVPRNDTKSMRVAGSNEDAEHSLHTLGAGVHGGHLPSRKTLIRVWQNWRTPVTAMLDSL